MALDYDSAQEDAGASKRTVRTTLRIERSDGSKKVLGKLKATTDPATGQAAVRKWSLWIWRTAVTLAGNSPFGSSTH